MAPSESAGTAPTGQDPAVPVAAPVPAPEPVPEAPAKHVRTHAVLIIPSLGHTDLAGRFTRGRLAGNINELDVIDGYVEALVQELEESNIRVEVMDTRSRPGIPMALRHTKIEKHRMVLHCCGGANEGEPSSKNYSMIACGPRNSFAIATAINEAVEDWGSCYVFEHKAAKIAMKHADPVINVEDTIGVRIEPFQINGPKADVYAGKLRQLGVAIAAAVVGYLDARGEGHAGYISRVGG